MVRKLVLGSALLVFLTGCGGDQGSAGIGPDLGSTLNTTSNSLVFQGRVQAPQLGFRFSKLSVGNAFNTATVSDTGDFALAAPTKTVGQLAFVFDQDDNVVYAAFQEDGQIIGPRTTAQVLIFFAAGGHALPVNLQSALRSQILSLPELTALENAIAASLNANVGGLVNDPAVAAALRAALNSMNQRANAQPKTMNRLLIQPSNGQSGIELRETGSNGLVVTNNLRRPAWAFVSKVSSKSQEGVETTFNPPVPLSDFSIAAVKGATSFTSTATDAASVLFGWDNGPVAGVPVSTEPTVLPTDGAANVRYTVDVVGPGLQAPSPTNEAQRKKLQELTLNYAAEIVLNFLVNTVLNMQSVGDKLDSFSSTSDFSIIVGDFIKLMIAIKPDIADKAAVGDVDGVLKGLYDAIFLSGTSQALIFNFVVQRLGPALGETPTGAQEVKYFDKIRGFMSNMAKVDLLLSSSDTAFAGASVAAAKRLAVFDVQAVENEVKLSPLNPILQKDGQQQFVATVPSITLEGNQFFEYHWTCSGVAGTLRSPADAQVNDFITSQSTGPIYVADGDGESDTIMVTVTLVELNQRTEIGTASTTVTVESSNNLLVNGDFSNGITSWIPFGNTSTSPTGPYPRFYATTVAAAVPPGNGPFGLLDVPYSSGGFIQTVTLPSDGTYQLEYLSLGQLDQVSVTTQVTSAAQTLTQETFTPPPTLLSFSPLVLSGADWSARSLTFTGVQGQSISVRVSATNISGGISGTIALFDNFVLKKVGNP